MKSSKVENYTLERIKTYCHHYPNEITNGLLVTCYQQSFGNMIVVIEGKYHRESNYITNKNVLPKLDQLVDEFLVCSYYQLCSAFYEKYKGVEK